MPDTTDLDPALDRVERSIDIDATPERVWALLEQPGWWINEGEVDHAAEVRRDGDTAVVTHPKHGGFRLVTEVSEPHHRLAYRWFDPGSDAGTLTEFTVAERPDGGVTLTVVESGFLSLGKDREDVLRHVEDNTEGWETELAAGKRYVEQAAA